MAGDYLIVNKKILPDYFDKVIDARNMLDSHDTDNVSCACRKAGISRSTYYKYKDFVFLPDENQSGHKAVLSMVIKHKPGSLSDVLQTLSSMNTSILTISQAIPVAKKAAVTISIDTSSMKCTVDSLISRLKKLTAVTSVQLNGVE